MSALKLEVNFYGSCRWGHAGCPVSASRRAYFFFGTTFDFDFSQTPESKVKSGVFNPLLAAIQRELA